MSEILGLKLEDQMTCYLAGEMSLDAFQEWFVPFFSSLLDMGQASQTARSVELLLAEYTGGYLTKERLSVEFRALARTISVQVGTLVVQTGSSSSNRSLVIQVGHMPAVRWGW